MRIIEEDIYSVISFLSDKNINKFGNKKILITGANGMLASYLVYFFYYLNISNESNIKIYLLTRSREKTVNKFEDIVNLPYVYIIEQDICEPINLDENIDYIIHAASLADPHSISNYPFEIIKANTVGTFNVCSLAQKNKCEIIFLSTREVYGKVDDDIFEISETEVGKLDQLNTRSCYPESKRCAEAILLSNYEEYSVPFKIVRIAHSYGPGMNINNDGRIMADLMSNMVDGVDILLKSDGMMKRSFCYISDAISAILLVMLKGEIGEVYNIANESEEIYVRDLAAKMADFIERKVVFEFQSQSINKKGYLQIPRVRLDTSKLMNIGWKPNTTLDEGIMKTYKYFSFIRK